MNGLFVGGPPPSKAVDFSIIIPSRGAGLGLWSTIHSCEIDLKGSEYSYDYVIVTNGEDKLHGDTQRILDFLKHAGKLGYHFHSKEPMSPPSAREKGAFTANGKILFFFDNHCLVDRDYFKYAMQDFEQYPDMDMLHSTTMFYTGEQTCYEYKLQLETNFWASAKPEPKFTDRPYRIAAGGHGGFAVRQDAWFEVGGYWDGFIGYGGEESYYDLKMALLGKTNWIDPRVIHYHYAGDRGYSRHYTDDYYTNMMACANIIGGEKWLYKVYESFAAGTYPRVMSDKTMFDLLMEARNRSNKHAAFLASRRIRTLDEQLEFFKQNDISF